MIKSDFIFNERIHATIINPYLSLENFKFNCDFIKINNIKNISTTLYYLNDLKDILIKNDYKINTLISYPFADIPNPILQNLVSYAKDRGANGIEYTPKFFFLSKNDDESFAKDIENIVSSELPITLILNSKNLSNDILNKAIEISSELGIQKYQIGDGFGPNIPSDIEKTIKKLKKGTFVKVVGGIKNLSQVIQLLDDGVSCVGTTNYYEIFREIRST